MLLSLDLIFSYYKNDYTFKTIVGMLTGQNNWPEL